MVKDMWRDYPAFGAALNKTGRPIAWLSVDSMAATSLEDDTRMIRL